MPCVTPAAVVSGVMMLLAFGVAQSIPGVDQEKTKTKTVAGTPREATVEGKGDPGDDTKPMSGVPVTARPGNDDPPGKDVWLDYDFVPGDRTLWFEDFSGDGVGDFPRRMELESGNLEVVEIEGRHYLRTVEGGVVKITLPEVLPQRFTVEVEYHGPDNNPLNFATQTEESTVENACEFGCYQHSAYVVCGDKISSSSAEIPEGNGFIQARFTVDGKYVKGYVNEKRVANVPNAAIARTATIRLTLPAGSDEDPTLATAIRIAEGGKKLYDVLAAKGRVATHGILFDSGSDAIRPESTPTLREIGEMLKGHPELKLLIEGHTDNVGKDEENLALSERRAEAVRKYLATNFGVENARLQSKGFGASRPVGLNATAEGRQNNRRVELVRI